MGIPLATPASRPGRRTAATLAVLLLLSACQADAGAAEQPAEGLLILTGGDAAELVVLAKKRDSDDPVAIGLPTPDGDPVWISAGKEGSLAGSTTSGGLVTSGPVDPRGAAADLAGLEWKAVKVSDESGQALTTPGSFPTWDPDGQRFAALGGDLLGGGEMSLLVVDPGDGKTTSIPLKRALLAAAPAWLDGERVAVVTGSADEPATLVVDTTNGKISKGPVGERRLATSGDGSVIATSAGPGAPILVRSSRGWLADDGTSTGSVEVPDGFVDAISLALDATGRRLAIVWLGEDGEPRYDVHDGADGWRRVLSQPLPGASAAVIAWLR